MKGIQAMYIKILFIYTKIIEEIYTLVHELSAVCTVSTFRPSTRTYCTKIKLVQHHLAICGSWGGGENFCLEGLAGVMACGGDGTLWGMTLEWGVSWQLWIINELAQAKRGLMQKLW